MTGGSTHWAPDPTSRRTIPRPKGWKTIRLAVLTRDGYQCTSVDSAGQRCTAHANQVDHIGDADDHSLANLRALCEPHHERRTARQANAVRWAKARPPRTHRPHPGMTG